MIVRRLRLFRPPPPRGGEERDGGRERGRRLIYRHNRPRIFALRVTRETDKRVSRGYRLRGAPLMRPDRTCRYRVTVLAPDILLRVARLLRRRVYYFAYPPNVYV